MLDENNRTGTHIIKDTIRSFVFTHKCSRRRANRVKAQVFNGYTRLSQLSFSQSDRPGPGKFLKLFAATFVFVCTLTGISPAIFSETASNTPHETLVNRRVLILDFVNLKNLSDYEYLENSIPDSFLTPLDRTKSFELLPRSTWQTLVNEGKFDKEDAYKENQAIEAGKIAGADVVIIGSFATITEAGGDKMQIFARAIELSSKRVMVSRNAKSSLNSGMFEDIDSLASEMVGEMKTKLPPLPQKTITVEREKYITVEKNPVNVTYGGQIWRTLVAPGWGHIYANEWRGWVYLPLWAGSLGTFIYGMIDYSNKEAAYYGATTGLDELYTQMNDALFIRNVAFVAVISIYALTIADTLIFGKNYEIITQEHRAPDVKLYAMILPGFSSEKINKSGDIYVRFEARKMF